MRIQHHVLWLQVTVRNVHFMQGFQDHGQRGNVKLRLLPAQKAHPLVDLLVKLPARDQFRHYVHARARLEGAHHAQDEGVVDLREELPLPGDGLRRAAVLLAHALQRVALARAPVPHQPHRAEGARADEPHGPEAPEREVRGLQPGAVHQLAPHGLRDDAAEGGLVQGPELGPVAPHLHRGAPGLVEEQRPLAEVHAPPQHAHLPAVHEHAQLAGGDHEEGAAGLALPEDLRAARVPPQHQQAGNVVHLLLRELAEHGDLLCEEDLAHVLDHLLFACIEPAKA
mmetsp:Transcript_83668/g.245319  ORF Transcript_83668/g.245319 Transcript_83668/m.245319 type:complete len:283 (+) Transcript_83668:799-1647(+)